MADETLISCEDAFRIVLEHTIQPDTEFVSLHDSSGRILAEDLHADRDFPPFDRVMMDGIAISSRSFHKGLRSFPIDGIQAAGSPQMELKDEEHCLEIMTGAVLSKGCDVVIRYEDVEIKDGVAHVQVDEIKGFQNIHAQGLDKNSEDLILNKGMKISPAEIGVAASIGKKELEVLSIPKVAIISTGDELVEVEDSPLSHQIRKSNVHVLDDLIRKEGFSPELFHLDDKEGEIKDRLSAVLAEFPIVLLSGGVSKGKYDFIPEALDHSGVEKLFHRVAQRPGKPFWFGRSADSHVFAFPGNPVSTFMCAVRYFIPWWRKSCGLPLPADNAILSEDFDFKPSLQYFLQVSTEQKEGQTWAHPRPGQGSGDLVNLVEADAFLELPNNRSNFKKGEAFPLWRYR